MSYSTVPDRVTGSAEFMAPPEGINAIDLVAISALLPGVQQSLY